VTDLLQDLKLPSFGHAGAGELGAVEVARYPFVLSEENLLVHLLKIEGKIERKPHPRVLELVAPSVEGKSLHDPEAALRKLFAHHAIFLDCRKVVRGRPVLGDVLRAPIELIGLERLQSDIGVAKILEAQLVEIIAPDVDVEILCPIVLHPFVDDGTTRNKILDFIGTIAERRVPTGAPDVALFSR